LSIPDITARIRFGAYRAGLIRVVAGEAVRIHAEYIDPTTGQGVDVTGVVIQAGRPDGLGLEFSGADLFADGTGAWHIDLLFDTPGTWGIRTSCASPAEAAAEATASVGDSNVVPPPPYTPTIVTEDLQPVVSQNGALLTVKRITAVPAVSAPDGLD
jgi:hypothetical protein